MEKKAWWYCSVVVILFCSVVQIHFAQNAGSALCISEENHGVNVSGIPINNATNYTICAWIYPSSDIGTEGLLFSNGYPFLTLQIGINGQEGKIFLYAWYAGEWVGSETPPQTISLNKWHHVAITVADATEGSATVKYYVDGQFICSGTAQRQSSASYAKIGNNTYEAVPRPFIGKIDELSIWTTVKTIDEIRMMMHTRLTGNEDGLQAYWRFDEDTGITVEDLSTNSYNGTLSSATLWTKSSAPVDDGGVHLDTVSAPRLLDCSGVNLQLNFTSKSGLDTIVATQMNCAPSGVTPAIGEFLNRYWIINQFGGGTFTTNVTFSFQSGAITDPAHPEKYLLYRRESNSDGTWTFVSTAVGATSNSLTFNGITSFGQFTVLKEGGSLTQWLYKRAISISSGENLSDYQVMITLTDDNFNYSHANPDGSDLRFSLDATGNDATTLPYWVEQWNESGVSRIWVKVPSINASSGATIYMYYGKSNAESKSNGDSTFILFDDFNDGVLDNTKWTTTLYGSGYTVSESNGVLNIMAPSGYGAVKITSNSPITVPCIIERKSRFPADVGERNRFGTYLLNKDNGVFGAYNQIFFDGWTGYYVSKIAFVRLKQKLDGVNYGLQFYSYINNELIFQRTGNQASGTLFVEFGVGDDNLNFGGHYVTDWIFVRAYASTEPTVVVGPENSGDFPLPITLTSFFASIQESNVTLTWQTATEMNNYGFEIERRKVGMKSEKWDVIAFVQGAGTSNSPQNYSFTDSNLPAGRYEYRLKQIDLDGTFKYSESVEVEIAVPREYALNQNYPNPFNPSTVISYALPVEGMVTLKVYDMLGKEVATLVNEQQAAGSYEVQFNASHLASGVYFYELITGKFVSVKKLLLMK